MKKMLNCAAMGSLVLSGIFFFLGCSKESPANNTVSAASKPPREYVSSVVPSVDYYENSGPIVVEDQVDILAQHEGVVAQVFAETGKVVKRGDVLAQLDDRQTLA